MRRVTPEQRRETRDETGPWTVPNVVLGSVGGGRALAPAAALAPATLAPPPSLPSTQGARPQNQAGAALDTHSDTMYACSRAGLLTIPLLPTQLLSPSFPPPVPPTRFCMRDPRAKRGRSHAQTQHDPAHFAIASSESYHRMSTQVELHVVKERRRVGPESGSAIRRAATAGARRAAIFRCSRATTRRSCWPHDVAFRRRSRRWQRRSSSPSSRAVVWC